jgi:hypothetical protein
MRRTDGELILFWTLPALVIIWVSAFFLFPGFLHPMSPNMSADQVASFYRDETARIRYSMILFNWFGVGLIPTVISWRCRFAGWLIARRSCPTA